jgi:alkyl sulfatase BDS1-like metallo-beta-lactamase superfamily hydrolase
MSGLTEQEQVYRVQKEVFERVGREAPHARQGLIKARLAMRLYFTDVAAEITISGKTGRFEVHTGANGARPDFDVHLSTATARQVLLKQVSLGDAVLHGHIKWKGPIWQLPVLNELFHAAQRVYPAVLKELE